MGYTTQEFTSAGLTSLHPAYYREFQIVNWTSSDIVVTSVDGDQTTIMKANGGCLPEESQCVCIEYRSCNGMRIDSNSLRPGGEAKQLPLSAKRFTIPLTEFKTSPVKVEEFQMIISTVENSLVAKKMMCDNNYGTMLHETAVDAKTIDPRFVFQVIDPNNQWDALMVNVFGQTVVLRSGKFARLTNALQPISTVPDQGRLICYLRYPTDMYSGCQTRQVVFDIELSELYKEEPYRLPSGDYICIAENIEALQRVIAKKVSHANGGISTGSISDKMVPKEVYETAEANFKAETERIKEDSRRKLESLTVSKNSEIATLKAELQEAKRERDAYVSQVKQWEKLNEASTTFTESKLKVDAAQERVRREVNDAARHDIDNMWATLKVGSTIVTSVLSFAITLLIKSKK